ncbi:hypothetical protein ScPMuIL_002149, partial [Solemya velum]
WTTHTSPRESGSRDAGNNWRDGERVFSVCLYIPPIRRLSGWRIITLAKECSLIFTGLDFIDDPTIDFHM